MKTSLIGTVRSTLRRVPPAARRRVDRARRRRILVSVVVPVYNVEKYVAECLESVLAQSHPRIEVVVVNDGSKDGSVAVVEEIAARDRRVRIIHQANGGLGAARNTGVKNARGDYVWFVDSDDVVPPRAAEIMLESLVLSGSDFAVGSLHRWDSTGMHVPPWAQRVHAKTVVRRSVTDDPEVLKDVFAWNKLFRREFFLRVVREYPAGLYEDQVPSARAYLNGTFDVLSDVVYQWRVRDDTSSITQQKGTIDDLSGRWQVVDALREVMAGAPEPIRRSWQAKVVGFDMRLYYEQVPRTDEVYWDFLRGRVRGFLDESGYDVLREIPVADRLLVAAVFHGHRDDVARLVVRRESRTWKVPGVVVDGRPEIAPEYFEGLGLAPDEALSDLSMDVDPVVRTEEIRIDATSVRLRGTAYLASLDLSRALVATITVVAEPEVGEPVVLDVERFDAVEADLQARDPWNDHLASGFTATVDVARLDPVARYRFAITIDVDGVVRSVPVEVPDPRGGGRLPSFGPLDDAGRWCVERTRGSSELALRRADAPRVPVVGVQAHGETVTVELGEEVPAGTVFRATAPGRVENGRYQQVGGRPVVTFTIPTPSERPRGGQVVWKLAASIAGSSRRLSWVDGSTVVGREDGFGLLVGSTQFGNVVVTHASLHGAVTSIDLSPGGLDVEGWVVRPSGLSDEPTVLALVGKGGESAVAIQPDADGRFSARLPVEDRDGNPLSTAYGFVVLVRAGEREAWLGTARTVIDSYPRRVENGVVAATITATPAAGATWVRFDIGLPDDVRSRRAQNGLLLVYRAGDHEPLDAVLFESFSGRSVGDSPLALGRELERRGSHLVQYWSVASLSTPVPDGTTALLRHSREWFRVLGGARYLVNNANWPWFFVKQPHQTYVQTWHGTPLKRIGNDVPDASLSLTYRELMVREAQQWDCLLAQNTYSAEIFPRAFGYDGPVVLEGYPRNDSLVDDGAPGRRAVTRERFGLGDGDRVVLYAPTWRDNLKGTGGYGRVTYLDFDAVLAAPQVEGRRTVILYRGHSNTANASSKLPDGVVDATTYPDVNDLLLASDALVTDYSSIMFDYSVMRKPIYFLVPDLDLYSSATRGFYRDLAQIAPGPLCASTDEVLTAFGQDYWAEHGEAYDRFVAEFAPLDDGHASARVVDDVLDVAASRSGEAGERTARTT